MVDVRKIVVSVLISSMVVTLVSCGVKKEKTDEVLNEVISEELASNTETAETSESAAETIEETETDETEASEATEENVVAAETLPAYEYPGPELFYSVLYKYLIDELGQWYEPADVCIPCPVIIHEDESNKEDIRVYGDFWIYNYDLDGDTLVNTSGGSHPGCIHLKATDEGYEVTGMDAVEDGSNYDPTAKKIFGEYYEDFIKEIGDTEKTEKIRAQIIANYVAANNLSITAYRDYGWDPVTLPEENIDSFYSVLN
ncbi:hypothetical protein SAMN06296386_10846 [Lachnospiraceae bacterium]|nr:hypothetical protein SAMN06296386_10846 [Lachnospiraceae bacterium]